MNHLDHRPVKGLSSYLFDSRNFSPETVRSFAVIKCDCIFRLFCVKYSYTNTIHSWCLTRKALCSETHSHLNAFVKLHSLSTIAFINHTWEVLQYKFSLSWKHLSKLWCGKVAEVVFNWSTTWLYFLFQGIVISHNASARVIRSNQSLVLQKVTRNSSGNYSCSAINVEGETVSNQLPLRVKCKFLCFYVLPKITFPFESI